jgi:transcriptional regulator with XRE-family HTH domain
MEVNMTEITIPRQVGQVVRAARKARGMSQAQLALDARISRQLVNRLEMGEATNISLGRLLDVLDVLGCTMSIDWDGDESEHRLAGSPKQTASSSEVSEYANKWRLDESLFAPRAEKGGGQ